MADVFTKKKRSEVMSLVRSANTKPEILVRKYLFSLGYRYSLHNKRLPGRPDIILKKYNTIIFINGCFWHGHSTCNTYLMPKTNKKFWFDKIENNMRRDKRNIKLLKNAGWKVIVIWECQLKKRTFTKTMHKVLKNISK